MLVFVEGRDEPFTTTARTIQAAVVMAFARRAEVEFEVVGQSSLSQSSLSQSSLIRRINAFDVAQLPPPLPPPLPGHIVRLATQLLSATGENILELFILQGDSTEKQFRVLDPAVIETCLAAVHRGLTLGFTDDDGLIFEATVKEQPDS
jgi:hypothetical protein